MAAGSAGEQLSAGGHDLSALGTSLPGPAGRFELLARVMNRLRRGVLIVDRDLQVLFANEAAGNMLARADAAVVEAGRFVPHRPIVQAQLLGYLASAAGGAPDPSDLALRLDRLNGESAYRVWVSPLVPDAGNGAPEAFLVMIFDPDTARRIKASMLTDLYGLTRAEADIAARLFQGLSVGEAAADLHISTNTARTHLRSIFRKCEVESQSQLLQLLSLGPRGD